MFLRKNICIFFIIIFYFTYTVASKKNEYGEKVHFFL